MAEHYNEVADIYDRQYDQSCGKIYYAHICDMVMESLPEQGVLLDLGCGTGLFLNRYVARGGRGIGLDISRGMILRAKERCAGCDVSIGTAERIPFKDESFHAVSSLLAFSYLRDPESMLRESYRVLKPGGIISICTLGKHILTSMVPIVYRIGERMQIRRPGMAFFGEHYYHERELVSLFEGVGFTGMRVQRCSFAHIDLGDRMFSLTKQVEPFIERNLPSLAYNVCISAQKPKK